MQVHNFIWTRTLLQVDPYLWTRALLGPQFLLDPHTHLIYMRVHNFLLTRTLLQVYNCFWTPQYSPDPNIAAGPQFLLVHNHF